MGFLFLKGFTVVFEKKLFLEKKIFFLIFSKNKVLTKNSKKIFFKIFTEGFSVKILLKDLVQKNFKIF